MAARRRRGAARRSSPAPTSPAGSTPATRRSLRATCARGRRPTAWRSAPRSSYPDLAGFGRRFIDMTRPSCATPCSTSSARSTRSPRWPAAEVAYVKPHGALYHAIVDARGRRPTPSSPPSSSTTRRWPSSACRARRCSRPPTRPGCEAVAEAFADRAYLPDGTPRAAARAGQRADRPRRGRRARGAARHRRRGRRRSTARSSTSGPIAVRARRHARAPSPSPRAVRDALDAAGVDVAGFSVVTSPIARRAAVRPDARWLVDDVDDAVALASARAARPARPPACVDDRAGGATRCSSSCDRGGRRRRSARVLAAVDGADRDAVAPAAAVDDRRRLRRRRPRRRRRGDRADASTRWSRRHTAATYTVAFCGFAPGFAYLTGLDPALHLPRRATPRTARAGRLGGDRRRATPRVYPTAVARGMAPARPHRRRAVGRRPAGPGAARARAPPCASSSGR